MKLPVLIALLVAAAPALAQTGATPAEKLTVPPGFKIELLKSAGPRDGSWISMAIDAKGRLYISPQGAIPESGFAKESKWGGLVRVTLDDKGQIAQWERVPVPVGDAMGMLWAFDSLYVSGNGPEGRGIYRLMSEGMSGDLDTWTMWKKVPGGAGEHGAHALVLGPDGKSLYIVHGNSTPLIDGIDPNSPYRNYREDDLLPPVKDPVATFFDKIKSPYGYVLRTDELGTKWELLAGGFRNPYDLDFNADGELFTYDSDMEWDAGLPWYRPTRVLHVVPGGEYGFREGSAKWPAWYPDSLPAAVDIGLGSPTGVKFGTRSNFPEKYRRAFFIMDWTFGRILAVHLHPRGASYTASMDEPRRSEGAKEETAAEASGATSPPPFAASLLRGKYSPQGPRAGGDVEVFVTGKGLPVSDLEFGQDGAMYFTIGGRGTQAGLYRVSGTGQDAKELEKEQLAQEGFTALVDERMATFSRDARRDFDALTDEQYSERPAPIFDFIGATDRTLRFSARVAHESQRGSYWRERALSEESPQAALTALLALARVGTKEDQAAILQALAKFPLEGLSEELKLDKLRVLEVTFARHGRPTPQLAAMGTDKLLRQYPAKTFALNRELSQLLIWLTQTPPATSHPAGEPQAASGSARAADGSPKAAASSAETAVREPRAADGSPRAAVSSGKTAEWEGKAAVREPRAADGSPGAAVSSGKTGEWEGKTGDLEKAHTATAEALSANPGQEVIARTLTLMDESPEPAEQIWFALCLREAVGWTPAQRERYFAWFAKARGYKGGNSFAKFILRIRDEALAKVPAADRPALLALAERDLSPAQPAAAPLPPRAFVKAWTLDELLPALPEVERGRDFARGKALYTAAQCAQCHQFAGEGGAVGPDLTALGGRFSRKDVLEAILEPSKALSEQYASYLLTLKDGKMVGGLIAEENNDVVYLLPNPLSPEREMIGQTRIVKREMSPVSLMPPGLLSTLTREEILDLLAYLESAGNAQAPMFRR